MEKPHFVSIALIALGLAVALPAFAADMPVKAPAALVAYDWTGFYAGGNVGYGVARDHSNETLTFPNGTQFSGEPFTLAPGGAVGGGQIGANWQSGRLVVGVEGDWQWSDQKDSVCIQTCSVGTGALNQALTVEQEIKWLATLRGRVGYADGFLWYVTGGGAWGRVDDTDVAGAGTRPPIAATFSRVLGGWTAGGGVETAITGHWTAKLEYLYVDLGSTSDAFTSFFNNTQAVQANVHDHIVRLGVNYRFGGGDGPYASAAPVYAAQDAGHDWRGFYIGANAGYGLGRDKGNEVLPVPPIFPAFTAQTFTQAPAGWPVGGQAGYNWQRGNWVAGLEGDWDWTNQHDVISITMGTPSSNLNHMGLTLDQRLRWLSTLRGRVGYDRGGWLWYVTGGAAFGSVVENDVLTINFPTITTAGFSHTKAGWTLGAGVEKTLVGNWTAKFEYLYADLGSTNDAIAVSTAIDTVHQNVTEHLVRLGVNYRFSGL
jgi:outer membrane immunogenic protein